MAHRHLPAQIFFVFKGITFEKLLLNLLYNNEVITIVMKTPYNGSSVRDLNVYKGRGWGQKSDFYYHEKQYKKPTTNKSIPIFKSNFCTTIASFTFAHGIHNYFSQCCQLNNIVKICRKVTFNIFVCLSH